MNIKNENIWYIHLYSPYLYNNFMIFTMSWTIQYSIFGGPLVFVVFSRASEKNVNFSVLLVVVHNKVQHLDSVFTFGWRIYCIWTGTCLTLTSGENIFSKSYTVDWLSDWVVSWNINQRVLLASSRPVPVKITTKFINLTDDNSRIGDLCHYRTDGEQEFRIYPVVQYRAITSTFGHVGPISDPNWSHRPCTIHEYIKTPTYSLRMSNFITVSK